MKRIPYFPLLLILLTLVGGCKKGFLDVKPNKALLVPETLADFWALLDNNQVFNQVPALTAIADGDFYTTDAGYNAYLTDAERNSYRWAPQIFGSDVPADWNVPYQQVFYANVVLDGLGRLDPMTASVAENRAIRGTALFSRAWAYAQLAQQFTMPYVAGQAAGMAGLPLRLTADVSARPGRGMLAETYARILADAHAAAATLPAQVSVKSRPNQTAAFALLARTYLCMQDFTQARKYADSALNGNNTLLDYSTLSTTASRPFPRALPSGNPEVIWYAAQISYSFLSSAYVTLVDTALYQAYAPNDLRKSLFFRAAAGGYRFNGSYAGTISAFAGLTTDELYLTRAECRARAGEATGALQDLNTLLRTRWKKGTYVDLQATDAEAALGLVLTERRKELVGRNLRWTDLRRLNAEARFKVSLSRQIKGIRYTLAPGGLNYTYPLPAEEVSLSGLTQNPRE